MAMLDVKEILKYIPHRYPFLLVDRILDIHGDEKIVGVKNVSFNENFFQGHFPNRPVMPGVLICEAMAQVGAILAHNARGGMKDRKVFVLTGLDNVKFKRPVEPGDQLRMELTCLKRRGAYWKMQGVATVDGKVVAQAEISAMEIEMAYGAARVMNKIHPTAIIDSRAELIDVEGARIASLVPVLVGRGSHLQSHVVVQGRTTLGEGNVIFPFASVGSVPQDLKYKGEPSELLIGNRNTIREYVSLNPGTAGGGMVTRVGDQNLLMMYCHIAHDCIVGDRNVIANGATLGGHVTVEDHVIVGGLVGIHQFVRIGTGAILGAGSMVSMDVPPYCNATGDRQAPV
jgi:UDP-N-acetylglucosamine acyltransferase